MLLSECKEACRLPPSASGCIQHRVGQALEGTDAIGAPRNFWVLLMENYGNQHCRGEHEKNGLEVEKETVANMAQGYELHKKAKCQAPEEEILNPEDCLCSVCSGPFRCKAALSRWGVGSHQLI